MNAGDFEELVESLNPINYLDFFTLEDEDGCNEIEQLLEGLFAYLIYVCNEMKQNTFSVI